MQRRIEKRNVRLEKLVIPKEKICKTCKVSKPAALFGYDYTVKCGLKARCKECCKRGDYKLYQSWEGSVKRQVNRTNRVWQGTNPITDNEASELLKKQNGKCNHCQHELSFDIGTLQNRNGWQASLDRIDTSIPGYGNGNAQWLCSSCNNGKNTSDDLEHKNKFFLRDENIKELSQELKEKEKMIRKLEAENKNFLDEKIREQAQQLKEKDERILNLEAEIKILQNP